MHRLLNTAAKRRYIRSLWVLIFSLTATTQTWAALTAAVDRTVVEINETLQLQVRLDGQAINSKPDFTVLETDFQILSNNRQQQYRRTNGRTESYTDWNLTLIPKRIGKLLIPPIPYKKDNSNAIEITVGKATLSSANNQPVFTQTLTDKSAVYIQEQLLVTQRLYASVQLNNTPIDELKVPGALVQKISEISFYKAIDNKTYSVVEHKYALFPQTSGRLDIPSISVNGSQYNGNTEPKTVNIMAKPAHINTDQWMPSSKLQINQQWSSDLDQLVVGEPITRTITISAKGLTGAQILPLSLGASDAFKIYPDQAQLDERINTGGVTGIRQESFALVPNREGTISLPEISLRWWDTVNQRLQTATLAATTLDVGAATAETNAGNYLAPIDIANSQTNPTDVQNDAEPQTLLASLKSSRLTQLSLFTNVLLLVLVMILFLGRSQQRSNKKTPDSAANNGINSPRLKLKQHIKAIQTADPRFTGRAIKNITDAVKVRAMDFELPDEWMEDTSLFLEKDYDPLPTGRFGL